MTVRGIVAGLDRGVLEAWSSPGLLAFADGARTRGLQLEVTRDDPRALAVEVRPPDGPARTVTFGQDGLQGVVCTCPAFEPCWHVLAAALEVAETTAPHRTPDRASDRARDPAQRPEDEAPAEAAAPAGSATPGAELVALGQAAVEAWAGARAANEAWRWLLGGVEVVLEETPTQIVGTLEGLGQSARFVLGTGLDGMIAHAPIRARPRVCAAVALAYLRREGQAEVPEGLRSVDLSQAKGAVRAPADVVDGVQAVLREMVRVGLSHLSEATAERLFTLSVSAQAAKLVRLGKLVHALHEDVARLLDRHALADEGHLFARMAEAYALAEALGRAGPAASEDLVGVARAKYTEVAGLRLAGFGARLIESATSVGLVSVFRDLDHDRWLTMADVRPADRMFGFVPRTRFHIRDVWGDNSFAELATHVCEVRHGKVSLDGRLSNAQATQAELRQPTPLAELERLEQDDFRAVARQAKAAFPLGLVRPPRLAGLCVLRAARVGPPKFDRLAQTLTRDLFDAEGRAVRLVARFTSHSGPLLDAIEAWRPEPTTRVLVELTGRGDPPTAALVSVLTPGPDGLVIASPSLDKVKGARRRTPAGDAPAPTPPSASGPRGLVDGLNAWAERGLGSGAAPPSVAAAAAALGLEAVRTAMDNPAPESLLRARYVIGLVQRAVQN